MQGFPTYTLKTAVYGNLSLYPMTERFKHTTNNGIPAVTGFAGDVIFSSFRGCDMRSVAVGPSVPGTAPTYAHCTPFHCPKFIRLDDKLDSHPRLVDMKQRIATALCQYKESRKRTKVVPKAFKEATAKKNTDSSARKTLSLKPLWG